MNVKIWALIAFILISLFAAFVAYEQTELDLSDQDIYYSWVEGTRIVNRENPYSRIHDGNLLENRKYATYFPLFYELSALSIFGGLDQFPEWLSLWRAIFLIANLAIAALIFYKFYKREWYLFGILASSLWLFNRWTLFVVYVVHLDILAILPFVLALTLFPKHRKSSLLLFGLSLAIKQIAIFATPLFLIWIIKQQSRKIRVNLAQAIALISSIPLLVSIPFLIDDYSGLIKSTFFSLTREPVGGLRAVSLARYLDLTGLASRLPLLVILTLIFLLVWRGTLPKYLSAFLVMLAFVEFNPVSFSQYMAWPMALLPFVIYEFMQSYSRINRATQTIKA